MEAESAEEQDFKRKATEQVASMMERADAEGKGRSAEQLQSQISTTDSLTAGSIILHMEFTGSKHCTADEMAELYCQAVLQMSARSDADQAVDNPLDFMTAETLQLLSETGVLDEFAKQKSISIKNLRKVIGIYCIKWVLDFPAICHPAPAFGVWHSASRQRKYHSIISHDALTVANKFSYVAMGIRLCYLC